MNATKPVRAWAVLHNEYGILPPSYRFVDKRSVLDTEIADAELQSSREIGRMKIIPVTILPDGEWTSELPTEPGWYWAEFRNKYDKVVRLIDYFEGDSFSFDYTAVGTVERHYSQPIPMPPEGEK